MPKLKISEEFRQKLTAVISNQANDKLHKLTRDEKPTVVESSVPPAPPLKYDYNPKQTEPSGAVAGYHGMFGDYNPPKPPASVDVGELKTLLSQVVTAGNMAPNNPLHVLLTFLIDEHIKNYNELKEIKK